MTISHFTKSFDHFHLHFLAELKCYYAQPILCLVCLICNSFPVTSLACILHIMGCRLLCWVVPVPTSIAVPPRNVPHTPQSGIQWRTQDIALHLSLEDCIWTLDFYTYSCKLLKNEILKSAMKVNKILLHARWIKIHQKIPTNNMNKKLTKKFSMYGAVQSRHENSRPSYYDAVSGHVESLSRCVTKNLTPHRMH